MCRKLTMNELIKRADEISKENMKAGPLNGERVKSHNHKFQLCFLWLYIAPAIAAVIIASQYPTGIIAQNFFCFFACVFIHLKCSLIMLTKLQMIGIPQHVRMVII